MKMKKLKRFKGFTLLELLVVIGIMGIIMALATVAYSATQISGRNARRNYSANSFVYPNGSCKEANSHMRSAWPVDPNTETDYDGVETCSPVSYCICATMEPANSSAGNSAANCNWNSGKTYYCVGNLQ
ncbi:MAG: hypothetical protein UW68_C0011G0010 [Candidatus Collierbacteria bacterium GW2011_GWB1_44_6]|uniref:Type II secretion system protein n=1 Tax=Candidatus Collierbacteria bacterium GW2011_GWB1_44_6 TaxID=1618384 RepID=A0A0G1JPU4_9BACT|nr:MAG: hypothetical protein UW68_C0011G0010 [Candidatus Collierbacteria bacterium GW2011_GWB1_44_6]